MNIGLYNLKYPARKLIAALLPYLKSVNPNWVSLSLIPVGICTAWAYFSGYLLVGAALIVLRMFLGTLDGLLAEHFQKKSVLGEALNRLTPEICDIFLFSALAFQFPIWGLLALGTSWMTSFAGLIGLVVNRGIQSVGPTGQTDRLAALILFSLLSLLPLDCNWLRIFLIWCTLGSVVTISLRLKRTLS
jgi:CDP-diacylglycerol--glycerol-3-phosphate 3-phosphatidyltransferase